MKEKYQKTNKILKYIVIFITCIILFLIYNNHEYIFNKLYNIERIDTVYHTDTLYRDTTITIFKEKPVPKYIYITKTDTFKTKDGKDTIFNTENKEYIDTLCNKNDSIILKSYISGQNPTLDSISAEWKRQETIITNTVEITKYIEKKRTFWNRLSIGPAVTAGYDPINKQFATTIGFGVFLDIK